MSRACSVRSVTREKTMTKAETRAVKIVELQEELDEAKRIIGEFVWQGDATTEQRQAFVRRAARFAAVTVPSYKDDGKQDEVSGNTPNDRVERLPAREGGSI